jgi:hypothetical protein
MKHLITAILFVGASQTSFAGIYDLKFPRVASLEERESCEVFLEQTAIELVRQSGVTIIDSGCQEDEFTTKGMDAVITYQAPSRLNVTSTYTPLRTYSAGLYTNIDECTSQLALQRDLFIAATGLQPLASYCMLDIAITKTWATRVDGLGRSAVFPDSVALAIWGLVVDKDAVLAKYQAAADAYGISIFEAGVSHEMGGKLILRFYSTEHFLIDDYNVMKYEDEEACSNAVLSVESVLRRADKPVIVFCVKDIDIVSRGVSLHATTLVNSPDPVRSFEGRELTGRFVTLAACEQAAAGIDTHSDEIFGAVCAGFNDDYRIHLFTTPNGLSSLL